MTAVKSTANAKKQPAQPPGEQLLEIIRRKNIPNITLPADENGNAYIDKDKYPDLYDWAANGLEHFFAKNSARAKATRI